uniref:ANK_REP_REGION domain-containing protein n=1 Tax=Parascaris equorum TaxID=6256 RepID=A0A914S5P5_PAREQ
MPHDGQNIYLLHSLASSDSITALNAVQSLLQSGKVRINERERGGLTALHVAAAWDHLAMCQLLLYYGADPFQTDNHGRTAYDVAVGETKCFFARAFQGVDMNSTNRIPRIGFLRALTELFACASASTENNPDSKRIRHSWSCLHSHDLDSEIARAKLISGTNIDTKERMKVSTCFKNLFGRGKKLLTTFANHPTNLQYWLCVFVVFKGSIDKEESLENHNDQTERNKRTSGASDELKSEHGNTSDDTFLTARTGSGDEQKDKCVARVSTSRYRPHLTSVWLSNDSSADELSSLAFFSSQNTLKGVVIGPLTPSTRCVYEMKLARVLAHLTTMHSTAEKSMSFFVCSFTRYSLSGFLFVVGHVRKDDFHEFSPMLERVIAGMSCEGGKKMDAFVVNDFFCSQGWRQGVKATSFCYILIGNTFSSMFPAAD